MTFRELRLKNYLALIAEHEGSLAEFARRAADRGVIFNDRHLSQLKNGKQFGDDIARKLEEGGGKPEGWIDQDHELIALGKEARQLAADWNALPKFIRNHLRVGVTDFALYVSDLHATIRDKTYGHEIQDADEYVRTLRALQDGVAKMRHERYAGSTDDGRQIMRTIGYTGPQRRRGPDRRDAGDKQ